MTSTCAWSKAALRSVTTGLSSLAKSSRMRSSTCSADADIGEGAASELGRPRHQIGVGRRADAHHEHARAAAHRGEHVEHLLLVADGAVGEEDHLPQRVLVIGALHRASAARSGGIISVPPVGFETADKRLGGGRHARGRRHGIGKEDVHRVVEADDVEAIGGIEPVERIDEAGLGLRHRRAAHRARIVDDEDHLARPA